MRRRKVSNLYEVVIDFSSPNAGSILANCFFGSIDFVNNEDNWRNFIPRTIYKSSDQIFNIGINIECNLVKEVP